MVVEVRTLLVSDISQMLDMARALLEEGRTVQNLRFDPTICKDILTYILSDEAPDSTILAAYEGERVLGAMVCVVSQTIFGPDKVASESGLFVYPGHRGRNIARSLLRAYVSWAKKNGAKKISVGNSTGMPDDIYVGIMESEGFSWAGSLLYIG